MKRKFTTSVTVVLSLSLLLAACSQNKNDANGTDKPNSSTPGSPAVTNMDPFGKYNPPITITAARITDGTIQFEEGENLNNNVWTKEFENTLGIKLSYDWTTSKTEDYINKLNVSIASGDKLPDTLYVTGSQLQQLVDANQVEDLTDAFNKYASPLTKKMMNGDGGIGLKSATFDGELRAIPYISGHITDNDVLWIREDWLKKLNLPAPKTVDDVIKIADAFVNQDPNGHGKKDTVGLGIAGGTNFSLTTGGVADLGPWFAGFKAYPDRWIKDQSGQVVNGSIQPEVKAALTKLQEMYKKGIIDKEFVLKDWGKIGEDIIGNKLGIWYGANWNPGYPVDVSKNKDLVNLKPYSIVSVDGTQPVAQNLDHSVGSSADPKYLVVRKGYVHPEAVVKLLNDFHEKMWGQTADAKKFNVNPDNKIVYFKYPLVQSWPTTKDVPDNLEAVRNAQSSGDPSKMNSEQRLSFDRIKAYTDGGDGVKGWDTLRQFDAFDIIKKDDLNNQLFSAFYGAPTPGMIERKAALDKLEQEEFMKIIMGAAPVDEFEKFVSNWKKLGGEQITKEVNDWISKQK